MKRLNRNLNDGGEKHANKSRKDPWLEEKYQNQDNSKEKTALRNIKKWWVLLLKGTLSIPKERVDEDPELEEILRKIADDCPDQKAASILRKKLDGAD